MPPKARNPAASQSGAAGAQSGGGSPRNAGGVGNQASLRGRPATPAETFAVHCDWVVDPPLLQQISTPNVGSAAPGVLSALGLAPGSSATSVLGESTNTPSSQTPVATAPPPLASIVAAPSAAAQQQQQLQSGGGGGVSPAEALPRCHHLVLHYGGDKLWTWGGWLGGGTDRPPADAFSCYDLTVSPSQQQQQQQAITAANAAAAAATAASGAAPAAAGNAASAAAPVPQPSHPGWSPSFVRLPAAAAGLDGAPHPAPSQFAWAEIAHGTALLFGGWTGATRTNALTLLSLPEMRWKAVETTGDKPPPLTFATAVCASGGRKFVVYGGNGVDGPVSDVFVLDLTTLAWRQMPAAGAPAKRSSHTATVVRDNLMVVFGGRSVPDLTSLTSLSASMNAGSAANLNTFSGLTGGGAGGGAATGAGAAGGDKGHAPLTAAEKLQQQALQAQAQQQQLLYATAPFLMNDIAVFDVAAAHWQIGLRLEGVAPPARYGHCAVAATPNHIVVFGGTNDQGQLLNDAWVLAFDKPGTILWRPVVNAPVPPPAAAPATGNKAARQQQQQQNQQQGGADGQDGTGRTITPPQSATNSASAALVVPPPAPRAAAALVRLGKSNCVCVVAGRTQPPSLLPVVGAGARPGGAARPPCSASVHFLDVTRVSAAEGNAAGGEGGVVSEGATPTP